MLTGMKQSFLEAEDDFCKLEYKNEDLSDLTIRLDRSKILTSGRKGTLSFSVFLGTWFKEQKLTRVFLQPLVTSSRSSTSTSPPLMSRPVPSSLLR